MNVHPCARCDCQSRARDAQGFVEGDGYVAIEAADTSQRTADGETHWEELPGYGETKSAMTVFPVTAESNTDSKAALEYAMYLYDAGDFQLQATLAPTLNFVPGRGLRFAVSVDDGPRDGAVDELGAQFSAGLGESGERWGTAGPTSANHCEARISHAEDMGG